ncbi:DUF2169 domain-containing protein [Sesbania bispinosa]|nr:DUF2169 domain-containing protein [Sesbania bispinosa]
MARVRHFGYSGRYGGNGVAANGGHGGRGTHFVLFFPGLGPGRPSFLLFPQLFLVRDLHLLHENPHTLGLLPESSTAHHLRRVLPASPLPPTRPPPSATGSAAVLIPFLLFSARFRFCSSPYHSSYLLDDEED